MNYAHKKRVKIWGEAAVVDTDPDLVTRLMPAGYDARPERAIVVRVSLGTRTAHSTSRRR